MATAEVKILDRYIMDVVPAHQWPQQIDREAINYLLILVVNHVDYGGGQGSKPLLSIAQCACAAAESGFEHSFTDETDLAHEVGKLKGSSAELTDELADLVISNPNISPSQVAEHIFVSHMMTRLLSLPVK